MKTQEEEALQEMETILNETRPKHLGEGIWSGVGSIIGGGVGAVGIAVLTPIHTAGVGSKQHGIVGGAVGALTGAVVGAVQAVNTAAGGVVHGVTQVVRGAANTPEALMAPSQGKWWNENDGKWLLTNLQEDAKWLAQQPIDNEDILGEVRAAWKVPDADQAATEAVVKDTYYYDVLQVPPSVNSSTIKRQYYILARRFSPDRAGSSDEVTQKFREIGMAYTVLSNPEFRQQYDQHGRNFMYSEDDDEDEEHKTPMVDPMVLYSTLFGSDKFDDYLGTLSAATSASVGDSADISKTQARLMQKRRVTKLALKLVERLEDYVKGNLMIARAAWKTEAEYLTKASYGTELIHVIGKVYTISAVQFLGSTESGIGLPSMTAWAKRQVAVMKESTSSSSYHARHVVGDIDELAVKAAISSADYVNKSPSEQADLQKKLQREVRTRFLRSMWTTTVVDMTNTLHEAAQMVLFDQSVDKETRIKRGKGLQLLGEIFSAQPQSEGPNFARDGQLAYEEVAFAAMLETCVRKEQSTRNAVWVD